MKQFLYAESRGSNIPRLVSVDSIESFGVFETTHGPSWREVSITISTNGEYGGGKMFSYKRCPDDNLLSGEAFLKALLEKHQNAHVITKADYSRLKDEITPSQEAT